MKRLFSLYLSIVLLCATIIPVNATEAATTDEVVLDNGITMTQELTVISQARASGTKTAQNKLTITREGTTIGIIVIQATFSYTGSTVSVVSKSVIQSDTYDGWNYKQQDFTSSGGTVTLEGKLTKWLILNTSFTVTLSCDKNGNISYT